MELTGANWRKSSYSNNGGNSCVEVAADVPGSLVGVRDSKDLQGPALIFTAGEWAAFAAGIRGGEFDLG
jgi:hypothetical protein